MAYELDAHIDQLEENVKSEKKRLEAMKYKILQTLKDTDRDGYKSSIGTVSVRKTLSVTTPKAPEDREAFFEHLKTKGVFEDMISVNSKTLNAWYNQEWEAATSEGNSDFAVPGIAEPQLVEKVVLLKKR